MTYLLLIILAVTFLAERVLQRLNHRSWIPEVPAEMKDHFDQNKYIKARNYANDNYRLGTLTASLSFIITISMIALGGFGLLDEWVRDVSDSPVIRALLFFGVLGLASDLIFMPFSIYKIMVIEEKYGFNRMTWRTFLLDKLKGYLLAVIIGGLLLAGLVLLLEKTGVYFVLFALVLITVFMIGGTMFYASWILPMFNKLTPLPEGELRSAIEAYSRKNNFPVSELFVMDGSKRSAKSNAFFSGLGKKKKIVLYDTLIKNHTIDELVAILAHEIGHYKLKHTRSGLIRGVINMAIVLTAFYFIQGNDKSAIALSAAGSSFHIDFLLFSIIYSPLSMLVGIEANVFSRKNEYQADDFAKKTYDALPLISALKKLSADNLSNLTPHPAYVFVHYSHPPLLQRIHRLRAA